MLEEQVGGTGLRGIVYLVFEDDAVLFGSYDCVYGQPVRCLVVFVPCVSRPLCRFGSCLNRKFDDPCGERQFETLLRGGSVGQYGFYRRRYGGGFLRDVYPAGLNGLVARGDVNGCFPFQCVRVVVHRDGEFPFGGDDVYPLLGTRRGCFPGDTARHGYRHLLSRCLRSGEDELLGRYRERRLFRFGSFRGLLPDRYLHRFHPFGGGVEGDGGAAVGLIRIVRDADRKAVSVARCRQPSGIFWDAVCPLRFFGRDGNGLGGCRCRGEAERCGFRLQRRFGLCGVFGASA